MFQKCIIFAVVFFFVLLPGRGYAQEQGLSESAPVAALNAVSADEEAFDAEGETTGPEKAAEGLVSAEQPAGGEGAEVVPGQVKRSSQEFVRRLWETSSQGRLEDLDAMVEEARALFSDLAAQQEAQLTGFPARGQEDNFAELNDFATMLFIQAEAYMNYGQKDKAVAAFQRIVDKYKWAQAWDPRGWFWSVAEKSQNSIDVMTGKVEEEPDVPTKGLQTLPQLQAEGTEDFIDYKKYGEFLNVGTPDYRYQINDPEGLSSAVGEGIYPNTGAILRNPGYKKARQEGRLGGTHWDFVFSDDLEAALYKWSSAKEPFGIRLFYIGQIFEKADMFFEAIKTYHSLIVHFPKTVGWTYWQTPWYPAQAAVAKIKHIIRTHPELNLKAKYMKIDVENGFDNDINNDVIRVFPGIIAKKTFWDEWKERLNLEKDEVPLKNIKRTVGSGKVTLVQFDNGHWQMRVNGKPFIIKGVTYAPTKIGQSPDKGTLVSWMYEDSNKNGLADGPYDAWVDTNGNNTQDADEPTVGDFQLMKEMGVNTIREYQQPFMPNKKLLRKMHKEYGFYLILGDFLGKYTLGSGATWFEGTDYENPEHQKNMMDSVRRMVLEFKDEPYLLLWLLGNENNYGVASNADQKPEAYFAFANRVAKMIKEIDPNHPVAVCNGDTLYLDVFAKYAPDIDIFAANVYRGDYGFGSFWDQVFDSSQKPAFITEYGCPAYARHLTLVEGEEAQANYHRGNWSDIEANTAGKKGGTGNALGGVVFEWLDEWWKNYEPFYHDRQSDAIGPFPGGYYFEEWFGMISQGNGTKSPFMRHLRKSYYEYQRMWRK